MKFLAALLALSIPMVPHNFAAAVKKKKTTPPAPAQTAFSQAALDEIQDRALNGESGLDNTAALVPFFEQILHPIDGGSVHILQYGDSHTASDDWANGCGKRYRPVSDEAAPGLCWQVILFWATAGSMRREAAARVGLPKGRRAGPGIPGWVWEA